MELFKIKDLVFRKEDFLDDISEFEDILPIIQELQDGLSYEEIECVGVNDCCNETNKNYVVEIQGFIDSNDEFITKEELMTLGNIDEDMLDTFIITIHMCVNCGKWVLGILEDEIQQNEGNYKGAFFKDI